MFYTHWVFLYIKIINLVSTIINKEISQTTQQSQKKTESNLKLWGSELNRKSKLRLKPCFYQNLNQ